MRQTPRDRQAIKAIDLYGVVALARKLGVTKQAVGQWKWKGIPATRVLDVERLTGVTRFELRPDVFGEP